MRKKIRILLLSQLCLFHIVFAQTKTVTGKVTDENGNPYRQSLSIGKRYK